MSDVVVPTEAVATIPLKRPRKSRAKSKKALPEGSIVEQVDKPVITSPPETARPAKDNPQIGASSQPKKKTVHASKPPNSKSAAPSKTSWLLKNTGATLHTIPLSSLQPTSTPVTSVTSSTLLCSYNWLLSGHAVQVPGGPPKWTPPSLPHTLPPDSGRQFIDQNASRVPKYPFEPAFRAMAFMTPDVKLNDVDIVVNRNSLRKLLDFAGGKRGDPWRMGLCMVRDTLFITRNERTASMMIHGKAGAGYGHSFEKAFTTAGEGLEASSSHHRVLRYRLGSLNCVVRFEVDAYLEPGEGDKENASAENTVEAITEVLATSTLTTPSHAPSNSTSQRPQPPAPTTNQNLKGKGKAKDRSQTHILHIGLPTQPSTLAELKTLSNSKSSTSSTPQLYFGRTPFLLTGIHTAGTVTRTALVDVGARFKAWEDVNQERLRKMVGLIEVLRGVVGGMQGAREAVLVYEVKGGGLRVLEGKGGAGVLPGELVEWFWGRRSGGG